MGVIFRMDRDYAKARVFFEKGVKIYGSEVGEGHPLTLAGFKHLE